jgi:hypothetical protein
MVLKVPARVHLLYVSDRLRFHFHGDRGFRLVTLVSIEQRWILYSGAKDAHQAWLDSYSSTMLLTLEISKTSHKGNRKVTLTMWGSADVPGLFEEAATIFMYLSDSSSRFSIQSAVAAGP